MTWLQVLKHQHKQMKCTKKPRSSPNLHQWIFVSGLQTPLNFSRISQNVTEPIQKPWKSKEPPGIWPQIPLSSRDVSISSIVTTKLKEKHCSLLVLCLQNLRPIESLFFSHSRICKEVHSGTAEQRKRLGQVTESITSTSMEHDMWEPDSIIISAITQIYWRRKTQTVLLYRCLCQCLFSSSIPLLFIKWKSNCQPDIFQGTRCPSQTSQYSKVGTATCRCS